MDIGKFQKRQEGDLTRGERGDDEDDGKETEKVLWGITMEEIHVGKG